MPDLNFTPMPDEIFKEVCARSLYTVDGVWPWRTSTASMSPSR
jgi:hypothetical protein